MAPSIADDRSRLQPTVEDCPDDDMRGDPQKEPQANIRTKRSQSSELRQDEQEKPADIFSDSGYSSRTAATVSTADSAESSQSARKTSRPSTTAPAQTPQESARRPETKQKTSKPLEKSKTSKNKANVVQKDLPSRAKEESRAQHRKPQHTEIPERDEQYVEERSRRQYARGPSNDIDQRQSHVSDPVRSPRSTSYTRHQSYNNASVLVQPEVSRQRRPSAVRPRPNSFHSADGIYSERVPSLPTQNQPHGPPPSSSAWHNPPRYPPAHASASYYQTERPTWPQDEHQYPSVRGTQGGADPTYSARGSGRPTSMYGAPQSYPTQQASFPVTKIPPNFASPITSPQSEPAGPSARYGPPAQTQLQVQHPVQYASYPAYSQQQYITPPGYGGEYSSESDSEGVEDYPFVPQYNKPAFTDDRAIMPPPQFPASYGRERRGSIYRNHDREYRSPPSPLRESREGQYPPESSRYTPSYNSSSRRPSLSSSARTKNTSYPSSKGSSGNGHPNGSRRRRETYGGPDRHPDFDYSDQDSFSSGEESYERPSREAKLTRRRSERRQERPEHPGRSRKMSEMDAKMKLAEDHQSDSRGHKLSASDAILREKATKGTKYQERLEFDTRSQRSSATRQSKGMTIVVQGEDDLNIKLDGNMDGQVLSFQKIEGGRTAIIVGSSKDAEKSYRGSERSYNHLDATRAQVESVRGSNRSKTSKTSKTSDHSHESRRSRR